jgi:chaperone LolA
MSLLLILLLNLAAMADSKADALSPPAPIKTPDVKPASTEQVTLLKSVDDKYLAAQSVVMSAKKTSKSGVFDQMQESEGTLSLKKGKLRLDLENKEKDKSLIVADGAYLWMVSPPPKEFKGAKAQVIKAALNTKQARSQGLLQVLTEGGVLKYFSAGGVMKDGDTLTYFLQPKTPSQELRRLLINIDSKEKTITQLKYWDSLDNETIYDFSKIKFDAPVNKEIFTYKPPKDADVITP